MDRAWIPVFQNPAVEDPIHQKGFYSLPHIIEFFIAFSYTPVSSALIDAQ
jgi:hypothetical protein